MCKFSRCADCGVATRFWWRVGIPGGWVGGLGGGVRVWVLGFGDSRVE